MKFRSAFAVLSMTVALAACGELPFQKSEPEVPAHSGPPSVSPLEQPIETGTEGTPVATAEASTMGTAMFRALGNGWTVTAADKTAVYERPGAQSVGVTVRRMVYGRGVEFIGTMNGSVFALNIQAAECKAGDTEMPFTARLRVGSQSLSGCAAPTDTIPKAQVRASSAAPKPKAQPKPAAPAAKPASETPEPETAASETAASETLTPPAAEAAPAETAPATGASGAGAPAPGAATGAATTAPPAAEDAATQAPAAASPQGNAPDMADEAPDAGEATAGSDATGAAGGVPAPELVLPEPPAPAEE